MYACEIWPKFAPYALRCFAGIISRILSASRSCELLRVNFGIMMHGGRVLISCGGVFNSPMEKQSGKFERFNMSRGLTSIAFVHTKRGKGARPLLPLRAPAGIGARNFCRLF